MHYLNFAKIVETFPNKMAYIEILSSENNQVLLVISYHGGVWSVFPRKTEVNIFFGKDGIVKIFYNYDNVDFTVDKSGFIANYRRDSLHSFSEENDNDEIVKRTGRTLTIKV